MGGLVFLVLIVLVPLLCARLVAGRQQAFHLASVIGFAGVAFLLILVAFDSTIPFTDGGDDLGYYDASNVAFASPADWFDTSKYDSHEQAGYPLLLSWVHQLAGPSLFHRKALNVFFMLLLALVWFAIGRAIGGDRLAFVYAYAILLAPPLWFYWLFLLKDLPITLLQSVYLLGLIRFVAGERRLRAGVVIALSTLAVIPFRVMLAASNLGLLLVCVLFQGRSAAKTSWVTGPVLAAALVAGMLLLVSRPDIVESFGAKGEARSLTMDSLEGQIRYFEAQREGKVQNPLIFPILYLIGETDALNPTTWNQVDVSLVRPVSMLPWIFFGLPFFLAGIAIILYRTRTWQRLIAFVGLDRVFRAGPVLDRRQRRGLQVLIVFIIAYAVLAWLIGTTVRWTLPAVPAMIAIAGFACANMKSYTSILLLIGFDLSLLSLIATYYAVLK